MHEPNFTISFTYHLVPESLKIDLCADVKMIGSEACLISNIQRKTENESSLLPPFQLVYQNSKWVHGDIGKESNLSAAISDAIVDYLQKSHSSDKQETNI